MTNQGKNDRKFYKAMARAAWFNGEGKDFNPALAHVLAALGVNIDDLYAQFISDNPEYAK